MLNDKKRASSLYFSILLAVIICSMLGCMLAELKMNLDKGN